MRIIAGEHRGRKLLPPESDVTRPITDRVKQSLFDIVHPLLEGARVYDCFAGTGSMGLESLSRGATHATFFEQDRSAKTRLVANINTLRVSDRSTVLSGDIFAWFDQHPEIKPKADLIFLDPPYRMIVDLPEKIQQLAATMHKGHLAPNGTLVLRHDAAHTIELPGLQLDDTRTYGGMILKFYSSPNSSPTNPAESGS